ncbi:hypothetical protein PV08_07071 [Exophiala spinifera]|uniref:Transcription factor domain-containing protein n=1 Tax=Exophiala spinifera TaxID=91928 RepID=A0A0D2BSN5_9EURO|nr:uncharacterized protein PV08_07071 [Exophiala spinifera]KIW14289.1 hypothetical protein PV08_07071 [Exophiala spinifera]
MSCMALTCPCEDQMRQLTALVQCLHLQWRNMFDRASLAILDRLDYAIRLLEAPPRVYCTSHSQLNPNTGSASTTIPTGDGTPAVALNGEGQDLDPALATGDTLAWATDSPDTDRGHHGRPYINHAASADALIHNSWPACTHVLEWPIFEGRVKPDFIKPPLNDSSPRVAHPLSPKPRGQRTERQTRAWKPSTSAARIHEDDICELVKGFLRNVHTKNPILDPLALLELTRNVAEEGFAWDNSSCLVLIASALGSLATTWNTAIPTEGESSLEDAVTYPLAEAYYTAARKRLGLLDNSIVAAQCWFVTGMYEMYSMRPLAAWSSFNRACNGVHLYLRMKHQDSQQQVVARPEQCLHWSSLKSECELREELVLPPSGLATIGYPGDFPSPPPGSTLNVEGGAATTERTEWEYVHEHSWYYYLSDVAYRRIANYTTTMLYSMPNEQWLKMGVRRLHRIAEELDNQTMQWWKHIPGSPGPSLLEDTDELTFMLRLDYVDLRERIWRPFLYLALHGTPTQDEMPVVSSTVKTCLDMSFEMLQGARLKHRHHGLWLTVRCMFAKALLIIAAGKSGRVAIRSDWLEHVNSFQTYLKYWEDEASDLGAMRLALSELLGR